MRPPTCRPPPDAGILRVPTVPPEPALTAPDLSTATLFERLRHATLGRYDVYAELGSGGMASVFLALDLALDRKVAIKVLSPLLVASPGAMERFRREARLAAALSHPHIVPIHAIGEEAGIAYFVMKYVEGTSLDAVLRREGRQPLAFAQAILGYVGDALQYAHARGVVHRDVKPANILLDRDGWCFVSDFGIAKVDDSTPITRSGVIIGTPQYMSPEQFNGGPVTGAADQYALGVVAYELLTGTVPFAGPSIGEVMKGHLFEPLPDLRERAPELPEPVIACVARMLAKSPEDRYPSVAAAVQDFGRATGTAEHAARASIAALAERGAAEQPVVATPTSPVLQRLPTVHAGALDAITTPLGAMPRVTPPPAPRPRRIVARRSLLVLAAVVGAAWLATRGPAPGVEARQATAPGVTRDTSTAMPPVPVPASRPPARTESAATRESGRRSGRTAPEAANAPASAPAAGTSRDAGAAPAAPAVVRIGSRIPLAVLYVNGTTREVIGGKGPQAIEVTAGRLQLSIRAENCQAWDTTVTAVAGDTLVIGTRNPRC